MLTLAKSLPIYDDIKTNCELLNVTLTCGDLVKNNNIMISGNFLGPKNMHVVYKDLFTQYMNVHIVSV